MICPMKKLITVLLIAVAVLLSVTVYYHVVQPTLAGGDKVRGDEGQGEVVQDGPTPFADPTETPAGPNY